MIKWRAEKRERVSYHLSHVPASPNVASWLAEALLLDLAQQRQSRGSPAGASLRIRKLALLTVKRLYCLDGFCLPSSTGPRYKVFDREFRVVMSAQEASVTAFIVSCGYRYQYQLDLKYMQFLYAITLTFEVCARNDIRKYCVSHFYMFASTKMHFCKIVFRTKKMNLLWSFSLEIFVRNRI